MIEKWEKLESETVVEERILTLRRDRSRSPHTGETYPFLVMEATDWINVIPITPEGSVVLIYQYRHGTEAVTLEIPGGMVDAGEETAVSAARELKEETGYEAEEIIHIGSVDPNPAILNNQCHTYVALNARKVVETQFDSAEYIEMKEFPLAELRQLVTSGQISHALVIAAFYHLEQYLSRSHALAFAKSVTS